MGDQPRPNVPLELDAVYVERTRQRNRTLEDALRPFAEDTGHEAVWDDDAHYCNECVMDPWPCKYETARRALEGEG